MRYLGIDLGGKRTGIAVGDDRTGIVSPLPTIDQGPGSALVAALRRVVEEHGPDALVVGLPLNMDGSEGASAILARRIGSALATAFGLPVHHHDERLTTFAANEAMAGSGRTRGQKKALRDGLAAATMLDDYMRSHRVSENETRA